MQTNPEQEDRDDNLLARKLCEAVAVRVKPHVVCIKVGARFVHLKSGCGCGECDGRIEYRGKLARHRLHEIPFESLVAATAMAMFPRDEAP